MTRKPNSNQQVSAKWMLAVIGLLVAYAVLQPLANARLGWQLPPLASLLGQEDSNDSSGERRSTPNSTFDEPPADSLQQPAPDLGGRFDPSDEATVTAGAGNTPGPAASDSLLYGLLRESPTGSRDYHSPAGLRYQKGSEQGHRLKHLERHLEDLPTRPGKHGVFYGDMPQVLRWIDQAYERGRRGTKGTSQRREQGRTIYEVSFDLPIGYVGGRDGQRSGNPDSKRVRLIIDGDQFITAFPF